MLNAKLEHKNLKKEVNILEDARVQDRSSISWFKLRSMKKLKLQMKDLLKRTKGSLNV